MRPPCLRRVRLGGPWWATVLPIHAAEGEGLEPPRLHATPVFKTGALPIRLTLRDLPAAPLEQVAFCMPQAGFEPASRGS